MCDVGAAGTSARVATLAPRGILDAEHELIHGCVVGSEVCARIRDIAITLGYPSVVPVVTGTAFRTGEHVFSIDPDDTLIPGFVLRWSDAAQCHCTCCSLRRYYLRVALPRTSDSPIEYRLVSLFLGCARAHTVSHRFDPRAKETT